MTEYMGLNEILDALPKGTHSNCMALAREHGALPEPNIRIGITVKFPAYALTKTRAQRWIDQVLRITDGAPLQYRHMKILNAWGQGYFGNDDVAAAVVARRIDAVAAYRAAGPDKPRSQVAIVGDEHEYADMVLGEIVPKNEPVQVSEPVRVSLKSVMERVDDEDGRQKLPWWNTKTTAVASMTDIQYVCPTTTHQVIRYAMRNPNGWWKTQKKEIRLSKGRLQTGYRIEDAKKIIEEHGWEINPDRWDDLMSQCEDNSVAA